MKEIQTMKGLTEWRKKNAGCLKHAAARLHKGLPRSRRVAAYEKPWDVKEGHFAVWAAESREPKRFVVSLSYLNHPGFLRLLEQAEEEYGFQAGGALSLPCSPNELEGILRGHN